MSLDVSFFFSSPHRRTEMSHATAPHQTGAALNGETRKLTRDPATAAGPQRVATKIRVKSSVPHPEPGKEAGQLTR